MTIKIVDKIIYKQFMKDTIIIQCLFLALFFITSSIFLSQKLITKGLHAKEILLKTCYVTPYLFSNAYPAILALSVVVTLLTLTENKTLIILKAAGLSTYHIIKPICITGIIFTAIGFILTAWIAPIFNYNSDKIKNNNTYENVWLKNGNKIIHNTQTRNGKLMQMDMFAYNQDGLTSWIHIKNHDQNPRANATITNYNKSHIQRYNAPMTAYKNILPNQSLRTLINRPFKMLTINQLETLINYMQQAGFDAKNYRLQYWQMIIFPINTVLLIIISSLFIINNKYPLSNQHKFIITLTVTLIYYFLHQITISLSLLLNISIWAATLTLPLLLFLTIFFTRHQLKSTPPKKKGCE